MDDTEIKTSPSRSSSETRNHSQLFIFLAIQFELMESSLVIGLPIRFAAVSYPRTTKNSSFCGLAHFYGRMIPNIATKMLSVNDLRIPPMLVSRQLAGFSHKKDIQ